MWCTNQWYSMRSFNVHVMYSMRVSIRENRSCFNVHVMYSMRVSIRENRSCQLSTVTDFRIDNLAWLIHVNET